MKSSGFKGSSRPRRPKKNEHVTRSGRTIKVRRSLKDRITAGRDSRLTHRAELLRLLPKNRIKRIFARLSPKYQYKYWFSREGGIMALKIIGIGSVSGFLLLLGIFAYFSKDLPNLKNISGNNMGGSIEYYDRTGKILLWQDYNAVKRIPVPGNQISDNLKHAEVAVEDKTFFQHGGFDIRGILRAALNDLMGGSTQGGSTITQQLVKLNENWTNNRTITRKIKEVILAVEVERSYTKDQILTGYLNIVPYGGVDYGAQAAAQDYFHENASQLTVAQSAMLASIPKAPEYYSPYSPNFDKAAFTARYDYILQLMRQQNYINKQQYQQAKSTNVIAEVHPLENKYANIKAPYFVLAAKNQLEKKYGTMAVNRGGWKVITTINMNLQKIAEQKVQANLPNVKAYGGDEEALAAEDVKTGQMVALVGGVNFNNPNYGQINYAQIRIPPGSSFKPYDYVSLINDTTDTGAGSVLYDVKQPLPGYPCTNPAKPLNGGNCLMDYDFRYPGPLPVRYALAGSRNVPAVKAMLTVGTNKVIKTADEMMGDPKGYECFSNQALTKPTECYASSAIGDGAYLRLDEHVNGLATLARLGSYIPQTYILKITDSNNKTVYQWHQPQGQQIVRPDAAYIVDNMLSDPRATYLPGSYKFQHYKGWDFAVKTGTTNDNFDGLMTSWSTQYAVASWVGYHTRNVALRAGGMEYLTEPLTRGWMEDATDALNMKPVNWQQPPGIKKLPAFVITHKFSGARGEEVPSPSTDIYPSWYKPRQQVSSTQTIDVVSGKLATSCTPALARKVVANTNSNLFSADIFWPTNQKQATSQGTDNVHSCNDQPPSISITVSPPNKDGSGSLVCDGSCAVTATVQAGTHPLSSAKYPGTVNIQLDGQTVRSFNVDASNPTVSYTFNVTSSNVGQHKITAQVIDSVLYQNTDSATVTFQNPKPTSTQSPISITGPTGNVAPGTQFNIQWQGGTGPYTITLTDTNNGSTTINNITGNSYTVSTMTSDPLTIVVKDSDNNSQTLTVNPS